MTARSPRSAAHLLTAVALVASVSCADPITTTGPSPQSAAATPLAAKVKDKDKAPRITTFTSASSTIVIDGPGTEYTVTVRNPGVPLSGVLLQGTLRQGTTSAAAGGVIAHCPAYDAVLPSGTCTMSFTMNASTTASGGSTLVAGPAEFRLELLGAGGALLDWKVVPVTLVSGPAITGLTLSSTTVTINAPGTGYTASVWNPYATELTGVLLQGYLVQGSVEVGAGGIVASCPQATGVLPSGACTMSFTINASTGAAGTGTIAPGPATFRLELLGDDGATLLDSRTVAVTLVAP
jgi:hypothetical protein